MNSTMIRFGILKDYLQMCKGKFMSAYVIYKCHVCVFGIYSSGVD